MLIPKSYCKFFVGVVVATIFLFAGFLSCQSILAQSDSATGTNAISSAPEIQIVATVEIYSAKITSQQENRFDLSFDFFNQEGVQPGIKYAVQLLENKADGSQAIIDEYVYPETIDLKEGQTKKMAITYVAHPYLSGEFSLWLASKNSSGLPLAFSNLGKVKLKGASQFVEILPETCFLTIEGSSDNKKYTVSEGATIKPEENLIASCQIINHLAENIQAKAQFQTFIGTTFGPAIIVDNPESSNFIEPPFKQAKAFSLRLPKPLSPNFYETKFWLAFEQAPTSNSVVFRYKISGQSGSIQNIIFDKDAYKKGETAQVKLLWFMMGGQSIGRFSFVIKDKQGKLCSETIKQSLDKQASFLSLTAPITRDCNGPKIEATLQDSQGNVLDSRTLSVTARPAASTSPAQLWRYYGKFVVGAIILVLLLILIIVICKKKLGKGVFLFIILGLAICFNSLFFSEAAAVSFITECHSGSYSGPLLYRISWTPSFNKSAYYPSEMANVSLAVSNINDGSCTLNVNQGKLTFNSNRLTVYGGSGSASRTGNVESQVGSPNVNFEASWSSTCLGYESTCSGADLPWPPWSLYRVVCVPLGSSGCNALADCCAGANSCGSGKCCLGSNSVCDSTCQSNNYCCSNTVYSQGKCCDYACPDPSTYCSNDIRYDGCGAQCPTGTKLNCSCSPKNDPCALHSQCCSGYCRSSGVCDCIGNGDSCAKPNQPDNQCCSGFCTSQSKCGLPSCALDGQTCPTDGSSCCTYCNAENKCGNPGACVNECPFDTSQCVAGDSPQYQVCGNYDADPCLEWSNIYFCPANYTCSNGNCIPPCGVEGIFCANPNTCCNGLFCNAQNNKCAVPGCLLAGDTCIDSSSCCAGLLCDSKYKCALPVGCPDPATYCPYNTPKGFSVFGNNGTYLCPSGTKNTCFGQACPYSSGVCSNVTLLNDCGKRLFQGTKYCNPPLGYASVKGLMGVIKLNLISLFDFENNMVALFGFDSKAGAIKLPWWKGGYSQAVADLVQPTDAIASPVRVQENFFTALAWKRWLPPWAAPPSSCLAGGTSCQYADDCCTKNCNNGVCTACLSNGVNCSRGVDCCTGYCPFNGVNSICANCKLSGATCGGSTECCSGLCQWTTGTCY